jgi:hypothetical protein
MSNEQRCHSCQHERFAGALLEQGRLAQLHAQHAALASQREAEVSAMFEPLTENDGEIDWAALLKEDQV